MRTDPVTTSEPIEGEYEVVLPPRKVAWTFWGDDAPRLGRIVLAAALAAALLDVTYRLLS